MLCFLTVFHTLPFILLFVTWVSVTLDSALTFSQHISNLTRSSYFQLRRLRTIRKAVSVPIFTSIVHAFVCSRIDYCNFLLIGFPKTRPAISPSDCTERSRTTHCQTSLLLPYLLLHQGTSTLASNLYIRIEYKVLLIVLKAQMGVAPKYLRDAIRLPTSASSLRPLRSLDRRELY